MPELRVMARARVGARETWDAFAAGLPGRPCSRCPARQVQASGCDLGVTSDLPVFVSAVSGDHGHGQRASINAACHAGKVATDRARLPVRFLDLFRSRVA
jgi:hypothetical protein